MAKLEEKRIKCLVDEGIFPGEVSVRLPTIDGRYVSQFAEKGVGWLVNGSSVIVEVLSQGPDFVLIRLPFDSIECGRTVIVNAYELLDIIEE